ncbi:outer membrane protein assembly factor BamB family protein [Zavarzinella formosa]|uniref:outer membrane protein assembly factor BamB family protein n=1 Tax=Zavarzinella formosa TaxID=360055 RepID=UPI0002E62B08|nr:PQQ-binding-like beta-propeller repeat protein [Zavarzinella formosa]
MTRRLSVCLFLLGLFFPALPAIAAPLVKYVSREDPLLNVRDARMSVGKDGRVYLWSEKYVLRIDRGGKNKLGGEVTSALTAATANADGVIATGNAHFNHSVNLWSPAFEKLGTVNDFLNNDTVEYFSPFDVQPGSGGDFYGIDQNRTRIVRVGVPDRLVTAYSLADLGEPIVSKLVRFRVWEKGRRFYVQCPSGHLRVVGFDGKPVWTMKPNVGGDPWGGWRGGFDVDDAGRLFLLEDSSDVVKIIGPDGKPAGEVKLQMGERKGRVSDLQIFGDDILVRRPDPIELFQVYDRATGEFRRVVKGDVEKVTVDLPSGPLTAGGRAPLNIAAQAEGRTVKPDWRVYLRPLGTPRFRELEIKDGGVTAPADGGGFYHLRITPDRATAADEYAVDTVVEIRQPGAKGSVSVFTPLNRIYYGQGERIPFSVLTSAGTIPDSVAVRLFDGERLLAESKVKPESGKSVELALPPALTAALKPGEYRLTAEVTGLTTAAQTLIIGPGLKPLTAFRIVQHGDYHDPFPKTGLLDSPEAISAHLERSRRLGVNLFVDRLGSPIGPLGAIKQTLTLEGLAERAKTDPRSPAPEKAVFEGPVRRSVAAYGAFGIEEQAVLLNMDAGLPVGTSFDPRKPEQFAEAITTVTRGLDGYPAFRGWSWAANWWIGQLGAESAANPEEKSAYQAALKRAKETGAWDPVLDRVSDRMLAHAVAGERQFRQVSQGLAPGKVSAMTGPYRAVGAVPPVTFQNADEVDLHYQGEQIQPPQVTPHHVDFYKRPGKRAWGHPELWNDDGTGGMIYPALLQMAMRGADGVGWSGNAPDWPVARDDPRSGGPGAASVHRNMSNLLRQYGPWMTTTENADRVAIVVSSRMMRIDDWSKIGGWYFDRLFEAYNACLYAHRPASFVFAEDATPEKLKRYQAVLVVGQRVELDPALAAALKGAPTVFCDGSCRPELVKEFKSLGVSFDKLLKEPSAWQDDSAYGRFPAYFMEYATTLRKALASVPPVATCPEPGVMLTERRTGDARFVWAVNNVPVGLDPGISWRVGNMITQRAPLVTKLSLGAEGRVVYDVFALSACDTNVYLDLRTTPARLYAVLPRAIDSVAVLGPSSVPAGRAFVWSGRVIDADGKAINASLPVRVRLLAADGSVLSEQFTAAGEKGAAGTLVVPLNTPAGTVTLELLDQIAGKSVRLPVKIEAVVTPVAIPTAGAKSEETAPVAADATATGKATGAAAPATESFGPHFRSAVASRDGSTVLLGAFNWDNNLYALDAKTGEVRWRGRVGHHFAYAPATVDNGFDVQGFDLNSAEGYHLYSLNEDGTRNRRFALYGLPKRATSWAAGSHMLDAINNFAVSPDGSWVASSGDLGLAVWDRDGKLLWSLDWWKSDRKRVPVIAPNSQTLIALDGISATGYRARTGEKTWSLSLAKSGMLAVGAVSADGRTVAFRGTGEGGRVYVLRDDKLIGTLPVLADAVALSADGSAAAVTVGRQLSWHTTDGRLLWTFTGDDVLRNPAISRDGRRVAVGSEIGTLYVFDSRGNVLASPDLGSLPAPVWLPTGEVVAATWSGLVVCYDPALREKWLSRPQPAPTDIRPELLAKDPTPTARRDGWGNAAPITLPLTPNLLLGTKAQITAVSDPPAHGDPRPWENKVEFLTDGKPDAPPQPWLSWTEINMIDSGWRGRLALQVDTFRTQLRVTAITFVEDPSHPESWLRDMRLQWWDSAADRWRDGPFLLSDAATHTHQLEKPIEAARFRFVSTGGGSWPAGNLRLGELVFHGEVVGASHPDVAAKRPVAVLFDEREDDLSCLKYPGRPFAFQPTGAYSGGKCLVLTAAGTALPDYRPPFGHAVPNWDFEIVENPKPGQYRYLQFAWKAATEKTTGVSLLIGLAWPGGGVAATAGSHDWKEGVMVKQQFGPRPPADWEIVTVDLWAQAKKPFRIQSIALGSSGGGALFDQVLLGRTAADLERAKDGKK